jgi:hypothetical protein
VGYWHTQHYLNTRETHVYPAIGMCLASYLLDTANVYAKFVTKSRKLRWKTYSTQGEMMHSTFVWIAWKDAFLGIVWRLGLNTIGASLLSYNLTIQEFAWVALSPSLFSDTDCTGK